MGKILFNGTPDQLVYMFKQFLEGWLDEDRLIDQDEFFNRNFKVMTDKEYGNLCKSVVKNIKQGNNKECKINEQN